MKTAAFLLLILSAQAFAQEWKAWIDGTQWVYFEACGFESPDDGPIEGAIRGRAPNIKGYWVRINMIASVIDWRYTRGDRGPPCASIYAIGAEHPVHVIGTTKEILKKLGD